MQINLFLREDNPKGFLVGDKIKARSGSHYIVEDRIKAGGNAVVHKCTNIATGEEFAIKFQIVLDQKRRTRFQREVDLLRSLKHDQLIQHIDDGNVYASSHNLDSRNIYSIPFIIMPLAESNLSQYLYRSHTRPLYDEYIGQFKGLAGALAALHTKAVHRDIKPENILIRGETWVLSDFGLCKFEASTDITETDAVGPRFWMSPESLNRAIGNNDEICKRSDVYQLCSVFWFVVTGRNPAGVISRRDWNGPENIFGVIFDSLSHDLSKRPSSGQELAERLDLVTLPQPATITR